MTNNAAFDASIPVLTEVFQDQPVIRDEAPAAAQEAADSAPEARAVDSWTGPERELMERRLAERILDQLQGQVALVLEQRLRDSMEEALQHAIAGLNGELRRSLRDAIEKVVVGAVAQELIHLQALKG